jgi:hypothetical protein
MFITYSQYRAEIIKNLIKIKLEIVSVIKSGMNLGGIDIAILIECKAEKLLLGNYSTIFV